MYMPKDGRVTRDILRINFLFCYSEFSMFSLTACIFCGFKRCIKCLVRGRLRWNDLNSSLCSVFKYLLNNPCAGAAVGKLSTVSCPTCTHTEKNSEMGNLNYVVPDYVQKRGFKKSPTTGEGVTCGLSSNLTRWCWKPTQETKSAGRNQGKLSGWPWTSCLTLLVTLQSVCGGHTDPDCITPLGIL